MNGNEAWIHRGLLVLPFVVSACLNPGPPPVTSAAQPAAGVEGAAPGRQRLVLWDGADIKPRIVGTGRSGRFDFWDGGGSWASCESKPTCRASFAATTGAGLGGAKGLKLHGEGTGWIGGGWSWFDWYPPGSGTDVSAYKSLTFQMRVEARSPDLAPAPANVSVVLACSDGRKSSTNVFLVGYAAPLEDAQWHKIRIPVAAFEKTHDGAGLNLKTVWEFRLSTWSPSSRDFNVYVDQIAVEN